MVVFPIAKINLGLYVTGRREDGYHDIETLFYPIGLSDILEVVPDPDALPGVINLSLSGLTVEGSADTNLVVKAYRLLCERQVLPGIRAYLHKCIPTGAGLGGGSSDGASMLLVLNTMFDLNLSDCDLSDLALKLGSDCPFFLEPLPSFARGRGEELMTAGLSFRGMHLYLFHPGTGISTGDAYAHVSVSKPGTPIEEMEKLPVSGWKEVFQNAFEPYAFHQQPVIQFIKEQLYRCGASYASMTGSGSAVYGLFDREAEIPKAISGYFIWREKF